MCFQTQSEVTLTVSEIVEHPIAREDGRDPRRLIRIDATVDAFVDGDWLPLSWWEFSDGLREDIADR